MHTLQAAGRGSPTLPSQKHSNLNASYNSFPVFYLEKKKCNGAQQGTQRRFLPTSIGSAGSLASICDAKLNNLERSLLNADNLLLKKYSHETNSRSFPHSPSFVSKACSVQEVSGALTCSCPPHIQVMCVCCTQWSLDQWSGATSESDPTLGALH